MPEIQRYPTETEALALCEKIEALLEGENVATVIVAFALQLLVAIRTAGGNEDRKVGKLPRLERDLELLVAGFLSLEVQADPSLILSRMRPAGGTQ